MNWEDRTIHAFVVGKRELILTFLQMNVTVYI